MRSYHKFIATFATLESTYRNISDKKFRDEISHDSFTGDLVNTVSSDTSHRIAVITINRYSS